MCSTGVVVLTGGTKSATTYLCWGTRNLTTHTVCICSLCFYLTYVDTPARLVPPHALPAARCRVVHGTSERHV